MSTLPDQLCRWQDTVGGVPEPEKKLMAFGVNDINGWRGAVRADLLLEGKAICQSDEGGPEDQVGPMGHAVGLQVCLQLGLLLDIL